MSRRRQILTREGKFLALSIFLISLAGGVSLIGRHADAQSASVISADAGTLDAGVPGIDAFAQSATAVMSADADAGALDAGTITPDAEASADKVMQLGSKAADMADSGNWWGVLGILLAAIPFTAAYVLKRYGTAAWMHLWYVPVLLQAAIAGGTAALQSVNAGGKLDAHTVSAFGAIFLKSLVAWVLLHMTAPTPQVSK